MNDRTRMRSKRHVPEWIFGLNAIPYGVFGAFTSSVMPFVLRQKGIDVGKIAEISALTLLPSTFQFLWTPLVDFGLRRRTWLILLALLGALCTFFAVILPLPEKLGLYVVLIIAAQFFVGLTTSCNGGLMATAVPVERMGRGGAWLNIGNLVAGALGAYVILLLAGNGGDLIDLKWIHPSLVLNWQHAPCSHHTLAWVMVGMLSIPPLAALLIPEAPRGKEHPFHVIQGMLHDVWSTIKSRPGWTGMIVCFSPVGTAVAGGLFSGIATDYHASDNVVTYVNGLGSAILTALGCYIGGRICDVMDRKVAYALAGGLSALSALGMMLAPMTPMTYIVGASSYLLVTGFCYSAFYAFVLEIVGNQQGRAASTRYTLFTAAANAAILYVTRLDGRGYEHFKNHTGWWNGPRGLLAIDAAANLAGILVLIALVIYLKPGRNNETEPLLSQ